MSDQPTEQTLKIRERLASGEAPYKVAAAFGLTRQRVYQIGHPEEERARRRRQGKKVAVG